MCLPFAVGAGAVSALAVIEFAAAGTLRPVAGSPVTVTAGPGSWPGSIDQDRAESAETRHCERHGHQPITVTAPMRTGSSGSPGGWPSRRLTSGYLTSSYTSNRKLASFFRNLVTCNGDKLDLSDQSRPGSAVLEPARRERTIGEVLALLAGAAN
jgi:hypothetical protein